MSGHNSPLDPALRAGVIRGQPGNMGAARRLFA